MGNLRNVALMAIVYLSAINKFNALDIQLYGYAKELFHEQIKTYGSSFNTELKKLKEWRDEFEGRTA